MPHRRSNAEVVFGTVDFAVVELDDDEIAALGEFAGEAIGVDDGEIQYNPSRTVWIGAAVGVGLLGSALAWWLLRDDSRLAGPAPRGHVLCPTSAYDGSIQKGDFVVVQLQTADNMFSEPTWAEVMTVPPTPPNVVDARVRITVRLAGENAAGGAPNLLSTDKHGFSIGDRLLIDRSCVFDRFRPGQRYSVLCGPAVADFDFEPIGRNQAALLGAGDQALVVVRGPRGGAEALWLDVQGASPGQQVLTGIVLYQTVVDDHGLHRGDSVEFLRDCVVDANFGGPELTQGE